MSVYCDVSNFLTRVLITPVSNCQVNKNDDMASKIPAQEICFPATICFVFFFFVILDTRWVDNHLVHVLSPNIYRTVSEALESFDYITTKGNFSLYERLVAKYGGAAAMYFVSKKLKKRHNITDERAALNGAAEQWVDALKGRKFLGDLEPNLADLAVFGVLRPIRHLKSGRDMVEHTRIGKWFSEMEHAVGQTSRMSEHR
ncbi:prostaglandin-E synthase [Trifolium repens]|nr:prostaglandin-E synthase [Trifolium repens]